MSVETALRDLYEAGSSSVTAPPFLSERVLARRRSRRRRMQFGTALLAAAVAAGVTAARHDGGRFFAQYQPSGSMLPTIAVGGSVVADRTLSPVDQDLVVISGDDEGLPVTFILRVMATGGEVIACPAGPDGKCHAWVRNGQTLSEPYVQGLVREPFAPVTVPPGQFFLLGDARDNAVDSTSSRLGTRPVDNVLGVVVEIVSPDGKHRSAVPGAPAHERPDSGIDVDPHDGPPPAHTVDLAPPS
jgi:signal peptidase I